MLSFVVELVPSNVSKLFDLLSGVINEMDQYKLAKELRVPLCGMAHEVLRKWLSRNPSWNELTSALMNMGYVPLAMSIKGMCTCIYWVNQYSIISSLSGLKCRDLVLESTMASRHLTSTYHVWPSKKLTTYPFIPIIQAPSERDHLSPLVPPTVLICQCFSMGNTDEFFGCNTFVWANI